jgi:cytoskeletal protein RodZ
VESPVFNDASGSRVSAIQLGSRIFLAVVVLLGAALALTLRSHVNVPGLERLMPDVHSNQVRPLVRTGPSNPPTERAAAKTGSSTAPQHPTAQPTSARASADVKQPDNAQRVAGSPTARPAAKPSSAATVRPTASAQPTRSARPTVRSVGQGTLKPRNPKAATPSPPNRQAPGQSRTPKPKPITDVG